MRAVRAGARGYVLKGAQRAELLRAIRSVAAGEAIFGPGVARRLADVLRRPSPAAGVERRVPGLTEREREILDLVAADDRTRRSPTSSALSPKTVRNHVSNIFAKLQARTAPRRSCAAREAGMGGEAGPAG